MRTSEIPPPRAARNDRGGRLLVAFIVVAIGLMALVGYGFGRPDAADEAAALRTVEPAEGGRIPVDGPIPVKFHLDFGRRLTPVFFIVSLTRDGVSHGQVVTRGDDMTHDPRKPWEATLGPFAREPGEYRVEVEAHLRRNASVPRGPFPWPDPDPVRASVTVEAVR